MVLNKFIKEEKSKVVIACFICGKEITRSKSVYRKANDEQREKIFCCKDCWKTDEGKKIKLKHMKQSCLEKYGVENIFQRTDIMKSAYMKKYGVENPFQIERVKKDLKQKGQIIEENGKTKAQNRSLKAQKTKEERYGDDLQGAIIRSKLEETNLKKYGSRQFFSSEAGKMTKENFVKRYGEEKGNKKWEDWKSKISCSLDNFVRIYGETEGYERLEDWKKKIAPTLENFILRYGEELGKQKFKNFYNQLSSVRGKSKISKLEIDFLDLLEKQLDISIERQISLFMFSWDGLLEDKKILLEVNGNFWHRDPRFYEKSFLFG